MAAPHHYWTNGTAISLIESMFEQSDYLYDFVSLYSTSLIICYILVCHEKDT